MCICAVSTRRSSGKGRPTRWLMVDVILIAASIVAALVAASYVGPLIIGDCSCRVRGLPLPVPRQFWEGSRQDL